MTNCKKKGATRTFSLVGFIMKKVMWDVKTIQQKLTTYNFFSIQNITKAEMFRKWFAFNFN